MSIANLVHLLAAVVWVGGMFFAYMALRPVAASLLDLELRHYSQGQKGLFDVLRGLKRDFGGLQGFFAWLERRKYKTHIRIFLSRWRSYRPCPECQGARLRPEALSQAMAARRQDGVFRMQKGYDHSYFFVSTFMPDHVAFHADALLE